MTRPSRDEAVTVAYNEVTATDFSPERTTEALEQLWDTAVALLPAETPRVVTTVETDQQFAVVNGWLIEKAEDHNCGAGENGDHEQWCGWEPIAKIEDLLTPAPRVVTTVEEIHGAARAHADLMREEGQSASSELSVDLLRLSSFALGAHWALGHITPADEREPVEWGIEYEVDSETTTQECGTPAKEFSEYVAWESPDSAQEDAEACEWEFREVDGIVKALCPDCAANVQPGGES